MSTLASERCLPCEGGIPPLSSDEAAALLTELVGWSLSDDGRLRKSWRMKDFREVIAAVKSIADVAEHQQHHPDLHIEEYRNLRVEVWTHAINGLTRSDFVLAAKIDAAI